MEHNKAIAIIQARVNSNRCPGKVMREVLGKPLIGHMVDRLRFSKHLADIIVATSTDHSNDDMCEYLKRIQVKVYRGCEDDVLERFYFAATEVNAKNIVRLTADCPLIDPTVLDHYIESFFLKNLDYIHPSSSFAEGLDTEVFTYMALEEAYQKAKLESEREHVTQYFFNNPSRFTKIALKNTRDDSNYRITVDEEVDFIVVKKIFESLYKGEKHLFGFDEIKYYLDTHKEVYELNRQIVRNEGLLISLNKNPNT
jgi:spore coat polysaccharide biosynthesis protein SpsF